MKVKFIKSPTSDGLAYFPGDVAEVADEELVAKLFKNGIAEATNEPLPDEGEETPPEGDPEGEETPPEGDPEGEETPPAPPEISIVEDRRDKTKAEKR